jgi:hypothetical protein
MQGSLEGPLDDAFGHSSKRKEQFSLSGCDANSPKRPRLEIEQKALSLKPDQIGGSWLNGSGVSAGFSKFDSEVQLSGVVPGVSTRSSILSHTSETASLNNTTFGSDLSWPPPVEPTSSQDQLGQPWLDNSLPQPQTDGVYAISSNMETYLPPLRSSGLFAESEEQNLDGIFWQNSMMLHNEIPANDSSSDGVHPRTDSGLSGFVPTGMDWGPAISSPPENDNRSVSDTHLTYQASLETQNSTCQITVQEISTPDVWSQPDTHMDQNLDLHDYSIDEDEIHNGITEAFTDGSEESLVCFGMVCSSLGYHLHNAQKLTFSDM